MNILVTGAKGFVGKNLVQNLKNIKEGKDRTRPGLYIGELYEYDKEMYDKDKRGGKTPDKTLLGEYCGKADFVFHLAGANRPKDAAGFVEGNTGTVRILLETLERCNSRATVVFSSSIQAAAAGGHGQPGYGESKRAAEGLLSQYARKTGAKVLIYRFPNLFGKWCRPNYNSVVATFCNAMANGLEYTVNGRDTRIELVYIDDLVGEMLDALEGKEHRCGDGGYCRVPVSYTVTLGEIIDLLDMYNQTWKGFIIPEIPEGSFAKKLYSTYLSYLPAGAVSSPVPMSADGRGVFAELLKTGKCGQVSVNVARPGKARGQHWHNSKWEVFIVVSGHGLIRQRRVGGDGKGGPNPVMEFEVTGERMEAVRILPGYAHSITNLSDTENLVTVMWANEGFDKARPDTFFEEVGEGNG